MRLGFFETWALSDSVRFHPRLEEPGSFFTLCFHLYLLQLEWYVTFTSTTKSSIYSIRNFCLSCYVFCLIRKRYIYAIFCHDIGVNWVDYYSPTYENFVWHSFFRNHIAHWYSGSPKEVDMFNYITWLDLTYKVPR